MGGWTSSICSKKEASYTIPVSRKILTNMLGSTRGGLTGFDVVLKPYSYSFIAILVLLIRNTFILLSIIQ